MNLYGDEILNFLTLSGNDGLVQVNRTGYKELDLIGYSVEPGRTKPDVITSINDLLKLDALELFKEGYTNVLLRSDNYLKEFSELPFNIVLDGAAKIKSNINVEGDANFIIKKEDKVQYAVVNGFLYNLHNMKRTSGNGMVYR